MQSDANDTTGISIIESRVYGGGPAVPVCTWCADFRSPRACMKAHARDAGDAPHAVTDRVPVVVRCKRCVGERSKGGSSTDDGSAGLMWKEGAVPMRARPSQGLPEGPSTSSDENTLLAITGTGMWRYRYTGKSNRNMVGFVRC